MLHRRLFTGIAPVLAVLVMPVGTFAAGVPKHDPPRDGIRTAVVQLAPDLTPYDGIGTWVDMYDTGPWKYPGRAVDRMAKLGVRTLYLQTSNWQKPFAVYKPAKMARLLDRAKKRGIPVVAWYLPAFKSVKKDLKRVKAALDFETEAGNRFDSFALDIEATEERNIGTRNERALRLSRRFRAYVGDGYALAAIIPDPAGQVYWPSFPYAELAKRYDVFMPMGYYTYRVKGYRNTYRYAKRNVSIIRAETGDQTLPVHAIGGIAGRATKREVQAFIDGSRAAGVSGLSLYDFPITLEWEWRKLLR